MTEKRILHLTDLHIKEPSGTKEHLRKKFYREYIDPLILKIKSITNHVDAIIISGDLIDKGSLGNFNHVQTIVEYLLKKLDVRDNKICFCIGNHDYNYELDEKNKFEEARKEFYDFTKNIVKSKIIHSNKRAILYEFDNDLCFLALDSTLGLKKVRFGPGKISDEEIDELVNDFILDNKLIENKLLIVSSHFPIFISEKVKYLFQEEEELFSRHFWQSATPLFTRIQNIRNTQTLWLFGDVHAPYQDIKDNHCVISTGRFGGEIQDTSNLKDLADYKNAIKNFTKQPRQARLICINENEFKIFTFNYSMLGHADSNMQGEWNEQKGALPVSSTITSKYSIPGKEEESNTVKIEPLLDQRIRIELISTSIEKVILEKIENDGLYKFNRFVTSKDEVSLGWISINQLLNSGTILTQIVEKSSQWLSDKLNPFIDESILVGLDFWGAIIASQISVRTEIPNVCSASRANAKHHSIHETFEEKNFMDMINADKIKAVILISDVIASGYNIINNKNIIKSIFERFEKVIPKWWCISIIGDHKQDRKPELLEFESIGVFCEKLRIPVISSESLPSTKILPPYLDFSK